MMKNYLRSLYGRISVIFLLLLTLLGIVQVIFFVHFASIFIVESDQKLNRYLAQDLANKFKPFLKDSIDYTSIKRSFQEMMVMNPRVEFYLLDETGNIMAYFAEPEKIRRHKVNLTPVTRFLSAGEDLQMPFYGDDPRSATAEKPISAAVIDIGTRKRGYLYVILGGEQYDSSLAMVKDSYILKASAAALAINFLITALIGLFLFFMLTRRLRIVTGMVYNFARGNYTQRIQFRSKDEIGTLLDTFNTMADTIQNNMEQIKNNDRLRRELIANISHDLRSPLASIQGYLETILMKENSLSPAERHRYLETVYKNILRLNHLVSDLFELSKLDARQVKPHLESFSIAELTQDVVFKFKPQAEKNKIALNTDLPDTVPMVVGDIGMIERALSNLIENALNYTPQNGEVRVQLENEERNVAVSVSDNGRGISSEDLPLIFNRFYRGDKSRSSAGTGLGLAITKKIIEAHHREIRVKSDVHIGTTFSFELPASQN